VQELTREQIIEVVRVAVEPYPFVIALLEGGSAAWGRADTWSDIDLNLFVDDGFAPDAIGLVDGALRDLSPIDIRFVVPQPTWHGHEQVFYRLRDAGEYLLVDLAVMQRSSSNLLRERERHGSPSLLFDKTGIAQPTGLDRVTHDQRLADRLHQLSQTFPLFQCLVKKEVLRGNPIGAVSFYYSHTLQPLMILLRIRHSPDRFDFGPRYSYIDLPPEVVRRIEPLWFVKNVEDIKGKQTRVEEYFYEVLEEMKSA
jgi:hypothetical protein